MVGAANNEKLIQEIIENKKNQFKKIETFEQDKVTSKNKYR